MPITPSGDDVWADFEADGITPRRPVKSEIRAWSDSVETVAGGAEAAKDAAEDAAADAIGAAARLQMFNAPRDGLAIGYSNRNALIQIFKQTIQHPEITRLWEAIEAGGAGEGGTALFDATRIVSEIPHFIIYGQSNSLGLQATPPLNTSATTYAYRFAGGVRTQALDSADATLRASLVDLLESQSGSWGQTVASTAVQTMYQLALADGIDFSTMNMKPLFSSPGENSTLLTDRTIGTAPYLRLVDDITVGHTRAAALNKTYSSAAMFMLDGESDTNLGTEAVQPPIYKAAMRGLQTDVEAEFAAVVPAFARRMPIIMVQVCSHLGYAEPTPFIARAQLELHDDDYMAVACPGYVATFADDVHYDEAGQQVIGAYLGRAAYEMMWKGRKPPRLKPGTPIRDGSVITLPFDVPYKPLVIDTSRGTPSGNGISVVSSAGAAKTVSSVAVVGGDALKITLSTAAAAGDKIRIGWTAVGAETQSRTNIRDSDPTVFANGAFADINLYNWALIDEVTVA